jgi:hypothetical protein
LIIPGKSFPVSGLDIPCKRKNPVFRKQMGRNGRTKVKSYLRIVTVWRKKLCVGINQKEAALLRQPLFSIQNLKYSLEGKN